VSALPIDEDGALRPALAALEDAVAGLCDQLTEQVQNRRVYAPSRYLQLQDAVSGEATNGGGAGGGSKSRPPFWVDSMDLKNEIDQTVEAWQPAFEGVPPTVGRLNCIVGRSWRPQDCRSIEQITTAVQAWALQIDELLNPKPKWSLPYPCPSCLTKTVYRRDSGGEMIRQPALSVSTETGVLCLKCRAHWPHGKLLFLGRLLGSLPENVGE
jgi:hypothetical protein